MKAHFKKLTAALGLRNVFNPSFYCEGDVRIFAFRAIPSVNDWVMSYVSIEDEAGHRVINLSLELYATYDGIRLIDPKIAKLGDGLYITFNSGYMKGGNDVFAMKIHPEVGPPKRLLFEGRSEQERNWGLFSAAGEVFALYWLNPLRILRLIEVGPDHWRFAKHVWHAEPTPGLPADLTIGTQPAQRDGRLYLMAHRKIAILRKKLYLGRLCELELDAARVRLGRDWWVHSPKSLAGSRVKHNTNLLSCTYFSGAQFMGDELKLGYGVNDVDFGFSTYQPDVGTRGDWSRS